MNEVLKVIYERRSIREFSEQAVDEKLIEQVIDAGRMAPSAMNAQPWKFYVLKDKIKINLLSKEIAEAAQKFFHLLHDVKLPQAGDIIFHGAPVVIFITTTRDQEWASMDVGACAQNIMLAATALGLSTCPIGLAKYAEQTTFFSHLGIPTDMHIQLAISLGYSTEKPKAPRRKKDNLYFLE